MEGSGGADEANKLSFGNLPLDVKFVIFKLFNQTMHKSARVVCKEWLYLSNSIMKKNVIIQDLEDMSLIHMITWKKIDRLTLKNFNKKCTLFSKLPELSNVVIGLGNSYLNLVSFLKECSEKITDSLTLDHLCFSNLTKTPLKLKYEFCQLKSLTMLITDRKDLKGIFKVYANIFGMNNFLNVAKFPNLEEFKFKLDFYSSQLQLRQDIVSVICKFLDKIGPQLKKVRATVTGVNEKKSSVLKNFDQFKSLTSLKLYCEGDFRSKEQASNFVQGICNTVKSFNKIKELQYYMSCTYYDPHSLGIGGVYEDYHATIRHMAPQLNSLRFVVDKTSFFKSLNNINFSKLKSLGIKFNAKDIDKMFMDINNYESKKFRNFTNVEELSIEADDIDHYCINWIVESFPNIRQIMFDLTTELNSDYLLTLYSSPLLMKLKSITWVYHDHCSNLEPIQNWCNRTKQQLEYPCETLPELLKYTIYNELNENNKYVQLKICRKKLQQKKAQLNSSSS